MKQLFLFVVVSMLLNACSEDKPEQDLTIVPTKSATSDSTTNSSVPSNQTLPQQVPVSPVSGIPQSQTTIPQGVTASTSTTGLNPEHGKPGHRCDISVGAPLNSVPTNKTQSAITTGAAKVTPAAAPVQNSAIAPALQNTPLSTTPKATTSLSGKINPAHGQPGHDCKVAVGQPLP